MTANNLTIGLDLGDRRHAVCVLSASGEILAEEAIPNTRECLTAFAQRHTGATFVMETGTHSPWVSRLLESQGHRVIVANARKLRAISQSTTKSDEEDARMLARLGRADPALLSPVKHRSESTQRALVQLKVREALVRSRVNQMNSVRFLVKSLGLGVPRGIKATAFVRQFRTRADAATVALVEPLLQTIDALNAQIKQLDARLETLATERYPVTARLRQVDGVGPLTALCFVLTVEAPERFPHTRDVGAYLGLVPRRDQSGNTDKQLPITKAGNTQLRCLLVNCAHYILGPFGPPSHLRAAGERIAVRGGKSAKKRAVIAAALAAEWQAGALTGLIARAADFYGPGSRNSVATLLVFEPLARKRKASWLVNDAVPHSFTYTLDAAQSLLLLAERPTAWNQTWHLPTTPAPPTGKEFVALAAQAFGVAPAYRVLNRPMIRMAGWFDPLVAESYEMLYQNDRPYLSDSGKFTREFGPASTPYVDGIRATAASCTRAG